MDLESIIEKLLKPDTAVIQQASKELEEAFKFPGTIEQLCRIMVNHNRDEMRQYAALLLKKRLGKMRGYMEASPETQHQIKSIMLDVMLNEKRDSVRGTMTIFFGCILRHESKRDDGWVNGILQKILAHCSSTNLQEIEVGTFVLAKLTDVAPRPIVQNFSAVTGLFNIALTAADEIVVNISSKVMFNILSAMGALVCEISGNSDVEKAYQAEIPHFIHIMNKFAMAGLKAHYTITLEILENIICHAPVLVNLHIRLLLEVLLAISSNTAYDCEMRIKTLSFINSLIMEKRKLIVTLYLIEPITKTIFEIIATEPESGNADEFFVSCETDTPLSAANTVLDTMAVNMPPEKFVPQLLALIEPAFHNSDDSLRRRAAFIVLGTISEGCRDIICNKYLASMLKILKSGLNDTVMSVRSAVLFALGQFSERLQPEIVEYANEVLPILLQHAEEIIQSFQMGHYIPEKHVEREFYALESFCESMEKELAPFMENLMKLVLTLLDKIYPQRVQIIAMLLAEAMGNAYDGSLLPWFQILFEKLCPLLLQEEKMEPEELRPQALNTLASLVRNVGQHFLPYAEETMLKCIQWIESSDDPDVCQSILNLFGALSSVVGEKLAPTLPLILKHIDRCLNDDTPSADESMEEIVCNASGDSICDEMTLDSFSDEESDNEYCCGSPALQAKEQAVSTIKELVEECPQAMSSYIRGLLNTLLKNMKHPYVNIRKSSISVAFVLASNLFAQPFQSGGKEAFDTLLTKYIYIAHSDANPEVVREALECIGEVLLELGSGALPNKELRESIALCVSDGLAYKYMCQFDSETICENSESIEDSVYDKAVIEAAASLMLALGKVVPSDEFLHYFQIISPLIIKHIDKDNEGELQSTRAFLIGILAESYGPLDVNVRPFFVEQLKLMICATKDRNAKTRQNAALGLGELVRAGKEISFTYYPTILQNLSQVILTEQDHCVMNHVVGALARLVLVNANLVPLERVISVIAEKISVLDDETESMIVFSCLENLFTTMSSVMQCYIGHVVPVAILAIAKKDCDRTLVDIVAKLLQTIHERFPVDFQNALSNPLISTCVPLIQCYFRTPLWQIN